jgi:hypothetical protein
MFMKNATQRLTQAAVVFAALVFASVASAQSPQPGAGKPILTVTGKIAGDTVAFDREQLESLGLVTVETKTPWYDHVVKFEGVPLDKLMEKVGAKGEKVVAVALNDYSSEIPIEDFAKYKTILALKRDGQYMPVRDKGPLFVIYPYDSQPELKSHKFYSRSVWQVTRLEVK